MSVQAMSWVIQNSQHKGSSFVVLLMIANHAQSDGSGAYPGIETLAREARITPRQVFNVLKVLERSQELAIEPGAGPHHTNLYTVLMRQKTLPLKSFPGEKGRTPTSPEPSEPTSFNHPPTSEAVADWVPLDLWGDYRAMREKYKRPLIPGQVDILIEQLRKLRDAGEDIREVLKQAIAGGWFEFKAVRKEKSNGQRESFEERRQRESAEAISEMRGRADEVLRKVGPTPRLKQSDEATTGGVHRIPHRLGD